MQVALTSSAAISVHSEVLAAARTLEVDNRLRYTNHAEFGAGAHDEMMRTTYRARKVALAPIALHQLPPEAMLHGGGQFVIGVGTALLAERIDPGLRQDHAQLASILAEPREQVDVADEVLVVSRYGFLTWGHWLGELLPQVVAVEHAHPGRFKYLVPRYLLDQQPKSVTIRRIQETLLAYGISADRLFGALASRDHALRRAFVCDSVWSDGFMHPVASEWMRSQIAPSDPRASGSPRSDRLAILRVPAAGRAICNIELIREELEGEGFEFVELGARSFLEQVEAFRHATTVFGILGSDLAGLLYAPRGVRVIAAAPHDFGDRFFYSLVVDRQGELSDVRGPRLSNNVPIEHSSPFYLPLEAVRRGLNPPTSSERVRTVAPPIFTPPADDITSTVHGFLEHWSEHRICGWLVCADASFASAGIGVYGPSGFVGLCTADIFRADLLNAGLRDGCCAFDFRNEAVTLDRESTVLRLEGAGIELTIDENGRISCTPDFHKRLESQHTLLREFVVDVRVVDDHRSTSGTLEAVPFALELHERFALPVSISGDVDPSVRSVLAGLPIDCDATPAVGRIQFVADLTAGRRMAFASNLHPIQALFVQAGLCPPRIPLDVPLQAEPCTRVPGIVFAPFSDNRPVAGSNPDEHTERRAALARLIEHHARSHPVYAIAATGADIAWIQDSGAEVLPAMALSSLVGLLRQSVGVVSNGNLVATLAYLCDMREHLDLAPPGRSELSAREISSVIEAASA